MSCGCLSRTVRARVGALTPLRGAAASSAPALLRPLSTSSVPQKNVRRFAKKDRSVVKVSDHMTREAGPPIKWQTDSDFAREPLPPPHSAAYAPAAASPTSLNGIFHWPDNVAKPFSTLRSYTARGEKTNPDFSGLWVYRPHYYELAERINATLNQDPSAQRSHSSYLLLGSHGSGKSHTLAYAVGHAKTQGAIVAYIPKGISLSMSRSEYVYSPQLQAWVHPKRVDDILSDLLTMNKATLPEVEVISYPGLEFGAGKNVAQLIGETLQDDVPPTRKQEALELIFRSLIAQDKIPFVFALDEVETCFTPTEYRDPSYHTIQSWQMALQRFFISIFHDNAKGAPVDAELRIKRGLAISALTNSQTSFRMATRLLNKLNDTISGTIWEAHPKQLKRLHIQNAKQCDFTVFNTERLFSVPEALAFKQISQSKLVGAMTQDDLRARVVESQGNPKRFLNTLNSAMYHLGMTV